MSNYISPTADHFAEKKVATIGQARNICLYTRTPSADSYQQIILLIDMVPQAYEVPFCHFHRDSHGGYKISSERLIEEHNIFWWVRTNNYQGSICDLYAHMVKFLRTVEVRAHGQHNVSGVAVGGGRVDGVATG